MMRHGKFIGNRESFARRHHFRGVGRIRTRIILKYRQTGEPPRRSTRSADERFEQNPGYVRGRPSSGSRRRRVCTAIS